MTDKKTITLKLANGTEFEMESFSETANYEFDTYTLFFTIPIKDKTASELAKKITPESMEYISILADGKSIDIIENSAKLLSVEKVIDGFRQVINVRAAMPINSVE